MIEIHYPPSLASHISLQPEANSKPLVKLLKNEVVQGKVLKSFSLGEVLLLIKGKKIMAKTLAPLNEGKILSLKVEELLPKPTLKLLGTNFTHSNAVNISSILSAIRENIWKYTFENINQHGLPKEALFLFRELMNDMTFRLFLESSPELLKLLIDQSGLSWEVKLRKALTSKTIGGDRLDKLLEGDLKGLVSKFLNQKGEESVPLKRLVSTIKNIQLLNHFGLEQDRNIFLPIPMQFPNGLFAVGQLLIHIPQREKDESITKKKDKNLFRITFLLELSHLGPLRADLAIKGREIEAKFLLSREEARVLVEKSMPIFLNCMREKGFSIHHVEYQLKEPEVVSQSLLKEIVQEEGHTISLVA